MFNSNARIAPAAAMAACIAQNGGAMRETSASSGDQ
jgi:hypothetical protein